MNDDPYTNIPDYLSIYDKNLSNESILLGTLIGANLPSKITSSGNQIQVTFVSDHYGTWPGFLANIHEEPKPVADPKAKDCSIANPCDPDEGHCQSDFECKGTHRCGENNCPSGFLANIHEQPKPAADPKARDCSIADPCNPEEGHCWIGLDGES